MLTRLTLLLVLALSAHPSRASAGTGAADAGQQLWTFLRGHGYGLLRMEKVERNAQFVEAEINGHSVVLTVDTGCTQTCLRRGCARDLALDIHETKLHAIGIGGVAKGTMGAAKVASFKLGGYEINRTNIVQVMATGESAKGTDGLLGYDFLKANATIIPVGADFVFYKPGNGAVPDISPYMNRLGFKPVPLTHRAFGLVVTGHIDGVPMSAIVDCGAAYCTFNINFLTGAVHFSVRYIGNSATGVDGHSQPLYLFTPRKVEFGGHALQPEEMLAQFSPALVAVHQDALLGFDQLAAHSAIIDLGHAILWLK
jgi:predicted aspartyl protease